MTDETPLPPGDAVPSSTESDPNVAVSAAVPSSTVETASAPTVSADAGVSQTAASSPAESGNAPAPSAADASTAVAGAAPSQTAPADEPQTFEQRVEARFLALEQHFMNLPHAIAQANGHPEPASWCERVIHFLFGKNEEPQA